MDQNEQQKPSRREIEAIRLQGSVYLHFVAYIVLQEEEIETYSAEWSVEARFKSSGRTYVLNRERDDEELYEVEAEQRARMGIEIGVKQANDQKMAYHALTREKLKEEWQKEFSATMPEVTLYTEEESNYGR